MEMLFYHKKFLADFLSKPRARVSELSLRVRPVIRLEAKEIIPPARVLPPPGSSDWACCGGGWLGRLGWFWSDFRLLSLLSVSSLFLWASRLLRANLSSDLVSSRGDLICSGGDRSGLKLIRSEWRELGVGPPSSLRRRRILLASSTDLSRFLMISASL